MQIHSNNLQSHPNEQPSVSFKPNFCELHQKFFKSLQIFAIKFHSVAIAAIEKNYNEPKLFLFEKAFLSLDVLKT